MNPPIYSYLPHEIIINILLRLPAKSIGRCRCVSKPWRALLSTPQFIKTHLDRAKESREEAIFLISYPPGFVSLSFDNAHHLFDEMSMRANKLDFIDHTNSWSEVIGSCNGLVLVGDVMYNKFLINPTLGEIWEVPASPFGVDANTGYTIYGLGYDLVNDDYKVVALSYYFEHVNVEQIPDATNMFVHVYSLRNNCWKKCECSLHNLGLGVEHITSGIFVENCVHWLARRVSDYSIVIAAFNLEDERFYDVPLLTPSLIDPNKIWCHYLEVLGGCLCICSNLCDVWMMKEYGNRESWTKFVIFDSERAGFKPMCLLGREKLVLKKCEGLTMSGKLVTYNLQKKTFNDIVVCGNMDNDFTFWWTYIETLVSPHHIHESGRGC